MNREKFLSYYDIFIDNAKFKYNTITKTFDLNNHYQKYNRREAALLARGKTVLDCFTHTGSFGLNCLKAGAKSVSFLDVSQFAIEETSANVLLNEFSLDRCEFICEDAFSFLQKARDEKRSFDFVILDPPAFTKSGKTLKNALAGYRELNKLGMSVLKRGGY